MRSRRCRRFDGLGRTQRVGMRRDERRRRRRHMWRNKARARCRCCVWRDEAGEDEARAKRRCRPVGGCPRGERERERTTASSSSRRHVVVVVVSSGRVFASCLRHRVVMS